jgi:hypothetical protein
MAEIMLIRDFNTAINRDDASLMVDAGAQCLNIYKVTWLQSYLANDGHRIVCHFNSPDTESARTALRMAGAKFTQIWPCSIHQGTTSGAGNVMVERHFAEPVQIDDLQAVEDAAAQCLASRHVQFLQSYFSNDKKHMLCLYQAPDAESVRQSQQQANMPFERVWPFQHLSAEQS